LKLTRSGDARSTVARMKTTLPFFIDTLLRISYHNPNLQTMQLLPLILRGMGSGIGRCHRYMRRNPDRV
jgi:hypothetical protein